MMRYIKKHREITMYLIVGILTTLVNIVIYYLFAKIFSINYQISNVIAWIIAVAFAFVGNKIYVFKSINKDKRSNLKEFFKFYLLRIASLVIDITIMYILIEIIIIDDMISKIISNIIIVIANYFFSKLFIFKK